MVEAVAFLTLIERHFLGGTQCRIGPNKHGVFLFYHYYKDVKLWSLFYLTPHQATSSRTYSFKISMQDLKLSNGQDIYRCHVLLNL
ncbi:unnamed protein product [Brugia pahangi]|uniref:NADH dehydrogenase subunit 1 n=1 Tax=Brugia pahangi TaxID=6280 RepID=A0A0N4TKA6_BRUPA|nr:unnamed protein product [Brugia pahangi]